MPAWIPAAIALAKIGSDLANSQAQKSANAANLGNSQFQTNQQMLLSLIGRGMPYANDPNAETSLIPFNWSWPEGVPTSQPLYTGTAEIEAWKRANDTFNATGTAWGDPNKQISDYTAIANQSRPAIAGATKTINDLFSGARTTQRLAEQGPVNQARLNTAAAQRSAVYQNLQQRLNELKAKQANAGFVGTSTFDKSAQMREAMPFYQESANLMSVAQLQNAMDEQAIRNQDWQTAFANTNLPYDLSAKNIAFEQMPALSAASGFNQAYGVYAPFLQGQYSSPSFPALPQMQPVTPAWGSAASVAGDFLSEYQRERAQRAANERMAKEAEAWRQTYLDMSQNRSNYAPSYNPYAADPYESSYPMP